MSLSIDEMGALEFGADMDDIMGDEEVGAAQDNLAATLQAALSGFEMGDDEVGAPRRMARRVPQRRTAAASQMRSGSKVLAGFGSPTSVRNTRPTEVRGRLIPVESTGTVAAGASQTIRVQPQEAIRPERFIYTGTANTFTISDFRIVNKPQFAQAGNVGADTFATTAQDTRLNFDACPLGGLIEMIVTNISGGAATFRASILGSAVPN